jgi:hypothetical protein
MLMHKRLQLVAQAHGVSLASAANVWRAWPRHTDARDDVEELVHVVVHLGGDNLDVWECVGDRVNTCQAGGMHS